MKILIIEDDPITAEDLRIITQKETHDSLVITNDFDESIDIYKQFNPDVLLTDYRLGNNITSPPLIKKIHSFANPFIVFITAFIDLDTIKQINEIRSEGYLVKPFRQDQIIGMLRTLNEKVLARNAIKESVGLSNREQEILSYISKGFDSKTIARALDLSVHTVDTHRRNLLHKFNASNTLELVDLARNARLI